MLQNQIWQSLYMSILYGECRKQDIVVQTGKFGADMKIELTNDGPVTIILEN